MSPYAGSGRPTQRDRMLRAFRAYFDLLDAAAWLRGWLRGQLAGFGLNLLGLRVLDTIYREGPIEMTAVAKIHQCPLQNLHALVERLEVSGWVRRRIVRRFPAEIKITRIPKDRRDRKRQGRRISIVEMTPRGWKFLGTVLPKHAKIVKALMRVLDGREQETLSRLCRKLSAGDILKFAKEMTHVYAGE
jgi:DNA-binding MarR family transcriptional regulator